MRINTAVTAHSSIVNLKVNVSINQTHVYLFAYGVRLCEQLRNDNKSKLDQNVRIKRFFKHCGKFKNLFYFMTQNNAGRHDVTSQKCSGTRLGI